MGFTLEEPGCQKHALYGGVAETVQGIELERK